jgi:hypothetical protein
MGRVKKWKKLYQHMKETWARRGKEPGISATVPCNVQSIVNIPTNPGFFLGHQVPNIAVLWWLRRLNCKTSQATLQLKHWRLTTLASLVFVQKLKVLHHVQCYSQCVPVSHMVMHTFFKLHAFLWSHSIRIHFQKSCGDVIAILLM